LRIYLRIYYLARTSNNYINELASGEACKASVFELILANFMSCVHLLKSSAMLTQTIYNSLPLNSWWLVLLLCALATLHVCKYVGIGT